MAEENIYDDILLDFDLGSELDKLRDEKIRLEGKVLKLEDDIQNLLKAVNDVNKSKILLVEQISSLFNTAKREIERKDRIIKDLRREKDDLIFKRHSKNFARERAPCETSREVPRDIPKEIPVESHDSKPEFIPDSQLIADSDRSKRRRSRSKSNERYDAKKSRQFDDGKNRRYQPRSDERKNYKSRSKSREREKEQDFPKERPRGPFHYRHPRGNGNFRNRHGDWHNNSYRDKYENTHNYHRDDIRDRERDKYYQEPQNLQGLDTCSRNLQHLDKTRKEIDKANKGLNHEIEEGEISDEIICKIAALHEPKRRDEEKIVHHSETGKPNEINLETQKRDSEVKDIEQVTHKICATKSLKTIAKEVIQKEEIISKIPNFDFKTYKIPKRRIEEEPIKTDSKDLHDLKKDIKDPVKREIKESLKRPKESPKNSKPKKEMPDKNKTPSDDHNASVNKSGKSSSNKIKKSDISQTPNDKKIKENRQTDIPPHSTRKHSKVPSSKESDTKPNESRKSEKHHTKCTKESKDENTEIVPATSKISEKDVAKNEAKEVKNNTTAEHNEKPTIVETDGSLPLPTFNQILQKSSSTVQEKIVDKISRHELHLTHEGEIPILHIEDMSFSNTSVLGTAEKNLYNVYLNDSHKVGGDPANLTFSSYLKDVTNSVEESRKENEESKKEEGEEKVVEKPVAEQSNMEPSSLNVTGDSSVNVSSNASTPSNASKVPVRRRRVRAKMVVVE